MDPARFLTLSTAADVIAGALAALITLLALGWVLDVPGYFGVAVFEEQPLALALGLALAASAFLGLARSSDLSRLVLGVVIGGVLLAACIVIAVRFPQLQILSVMRPLWLVILSLAVIAGLLLLTGRILGWAIVAVVVVFSALAILGGGLGIPETPLDRWAVYMVSDANAILGLPFRVAVQIVIPFILFGELLRVTGGGEYMTRLSLAAFGRYRGGSAKAAVGASAMFGAISGNAVSNVAGTGVVTIPLMIRTGMTRATAAALEAAASTGGQLLPPVMGAAAFVMADMLRIPYLQVAAAAALPAALYFIALMVQIDRIAARRNVGAIAPDELPALGRTVWQGAHFALPFVAMVIMLMRNQTRPELAALAAIAVLVIASVLRPYEGRRLSLAGVVEAVVSTGRSVAPLLMVAAAAGMIIGLVSLTGLGFSVAADAIATAGGSRIVLLLLVAVMAIVFGMGMPTVAVYVVLATLLAPALTAVGLTGLQAHFFILYFGMMSMLTPPVALASITAARIAGAGMWSTSFRAMGLAWVAYIVPILFAFSPALLLQGGFGAAGLAALTAILGTSAISIGAVGYWHGVLGLPARGATVVAGALLLLPTAPDSSYVWLNVAGFAALALLFLITRSGQTAAPAILKTTEGKEE